MTVEKPSICGGQGTICCQARFKVSLDPKRTLLRKRELPYTWLA